MEKEDVGLSRKPRLVLAWIGINFFLSVLIASILNAASDRSFWLAFQSSLFYTYLISGMSAGAGYGSANLFSKSSFPVQLAGGTMATLLGTTGALVVCYMLTPILFGPPEARDGLTLLKKLTPAIFLLSGLLAFISLYVEHLRRSRFPEPSPNPEEDLGKPGEISPPRFVLKERENEHVLEFEDIVYLSSHGRRTTIHTRDDSIVVARLLKELVELLPAKSFVRIHKQYVLNAGYLRRLQHENAGRYRAYLKDEEATSLPVGRSFLPRLRKTLPG